MFGINDEVVNTGFGKNDEVVSSKQYNPSPIFSVNAPITNQDIITPTDIITGMVPWKAIGGLIKERVTKPAVLDIANKLPNTGIPKNRLLFPKSISDIGFNLGTQVSPRSGITNIADIIADPRTYIPAGVPEKGQLLLGRAGQKIESNLPKIEEAVAGTKNWGIFKQGRDYIYDKLAKPAVEYISQHIKNNPDLAQKAFKLRDETVALIKQHGYDKVADVQGADQLAKNAFNMANSKKATVYGDRINIADTIDLVGKKFNEIKKVDPSNPLGKLYQNIKNLRPAPKGFYAKGERVPTPTQLGRMFKGEHLSDIAREGRITREQFSNIRQQVDNLYKARVINKGDVLDIVDSLYNDAEKSGLTGMQNARELYHQARQFEDVASNLSNMGKIDIAQIHKDITSVVKDANKYKVMIDKYAPRMGVDKAHELFKQALSIRHGKQAIKGAVVAGVLGTGGHKVMSILK